MLNKLVIIKNPCKSYATVSQTLTIIIADDHPMFRGALVAALSSHYASASFIEAGDMESLQRSLESGIDADLLLLDLHMPGVMGFSGLSFIRGQYPDLPVIEG